MADTAVVAAQVVAAVDDNSDSKEVERDRSNDDVFDKFVVCIVNYAPVVLGVTFLISSVLAVWTISIVYELGAERTFAFGDGNSDRDDIHTLAHEGVRQAQEEAGFRWRMKTNDLHGDGGPDFCSLERDENKRDDDGKRRRRLQLQADLAAQQQQTSPTALLQQRSSLPFQQMRPRALPGVQSPQPGGGVGSWQFARADSFPDLFDGGFAPGQRPPISTPTPAFRGFVAELRRGRRAGPLNQSAAAVGSQDVGPGDEGTPQASQRRRLQGANQGVCDIFDWGNSITLRSFESTVHDEVWGPISDP
jgi:hypothetical protein